MLRPKICVSILTHSTEDTVKKITGLEDPDIIELRLDHAKETINLDKIRCMTHTPMIMTVRLASHGGCWERDDEERRYFMKTALESGFDYIDIEADSKFLSPMVDNAHDSGAKVIASMHFIDRVPRVEEIESVYKKTRAEEADIIKVVGHTLSASDNLVFFEFLRAHPGNISFGLGPEGVVSRIMSPLLGGAFTYASIDEGLEAAPGQLTLHRLREIYRLMGV